MNLKHLALAASALAIMAGCQKEIGKTVNASDEVRFSTNIRSIGTKADKVSFAENDLVNVYMVETGQALSDSKSYKVTSENKLTPSGTDKWKYPLSGNVDFYAVHPSTATVSEGKLSLDFNNDYIYAVKKNQARTADEVALTFNHALSKLTLVISKGATVSSLQGLTVKITGMPKTATVSLSDSQYTPGEAQEIVLVDNSTETGESLTLTTYAIPGTFASAKIVFTLNEKTIEGAIGTFNFEAGKEIRQPVTLNQDANVTFGTATISAWTPLAENADMPVVLPAE